MEQMPHHREGIQNDLDKAYDEGHEDNRTINEERELQEELRIAIDASNRVIADVTGVSARETYEKKWVKSEANYKSINPENIKSFPLPEMVGKTIGEVFEYVKIKYGNDYYIPDVEYGEYLSANERTMGSSGYRDWNIKIPRALVENEEVNFLFLGSVHKPDGDNDIGVTSGNCEGRDTFGFGYSGRTLKDLYGPDDRIIVVKK